MSFYIIQYLCLTFSSLSYYVLKNAIASYFSPRYLEQRDKTMHAKAKTVIKECYEKKKAGDPEYSGSLTVIMKARLRATVGEAYWKMCHHLLVCSEVGTALGASPSGGDVVGAADAKEVEESAKAKYGNSIEECANQYFCQIYQSEEGARNVVEVLKSFKASGNSRENDIFACMIHNLFDEYRFFSKYPEKELRITGILFGLLIKEHLISSVTLGIALRYVLVALRKPPNQSPQSGKMFRFGIFALEQFKERLGEWPQFVLHIVQIPHLREGFQQLVGEIQADIEALSSGL